MEANENGFLKILGKLKLSEKNVSIVEDENKMFDPDKVYKSLLLVR